MLKVKEFLKNLKLRLIRYLTPISYMEYSIKMCFILKVKQLRLLSYMLLVFNLVMLLLSLIYSKVINPMSIVMSMVITHLALSIFIGWRKRIKGIKDKEELPEVTLRPLTLKSYEVPIVLRRFNKTNKHTEGE